MTYNQVKSFIELILQKLHHDKERNQENILQIVQSLWVKWLALAK